MIIGCEFYHIRGKTLFGSGFCESAALCAERLTITGPFDITGYDLRGGLEDDDPIDIKIYKPAVNGEGYSWHTAIWKRPGYPYLEKECVVAVMNREIKENA